MFAPRPARLVRLPAPLLGLLAMSAVSCGDGGVDDTFVDVYFLADDAVSSQADELRIRVMDRDGMERRRFNRPVADVTFPTGMRLVPMGGDSDRGYEVLGELADDDGLVIVSVRAIAGFVQGEGRELRLTFAGDCVGRTDCGGRSTCDGGACVSACVLPRVPGTAAAPERVSCPAPDPDFVHVGAGERHACAVREDGAVLCWGDNELGQLGLPEPRVYPEAQRVEGLTGIVQLDGGSEHTCAVDGMGRLYCWGANGSGQIGVPEAPSPTTPLHVGGALRFRQVSAALNNTCAVATTGEVYCFGQNSWGQVGNGTTGNTDAPAKAMGIADVAAVRMGPIHVCAVGSGGELWCWGQNERHQLGFEGGSQTNAEMKPFEWAPAVVSSVRNVADVGLGYQTTCAVYTDGLSACWGRNFEGALGRGECSDGSAAPQEVAGVAAGVQIATGQYTSFVRTEGGGLVSWGRNHLQQLAHACGDAGGCTEGRCPSSAPAEGVPIVVDVAAGRDFACALVQSGAVMCWGDNGSGQLGNGTVGGAIGIPAEIQ